MPREGSTRNPFSNTSMRVERRRAEIPEKQWSVGYRDFSSNSLRGEPNAHLSCLVALDAQAPANPAWSRQRGRVSGNLQLNASNQ